MLRCYIFQNEYKAELSQHRNERRGYQEDIDHVKDITLARFIGMHAHASKFCPLVAPLAYKLEPRSGPMKHMFVAKDSKLPSMHRDNALNV